MKTVYLLRRQAEKDRTLGVLQIFDGLTMQAKFTTLEPPWLNNAANKSCIPAGIYTIKPRHTPKYGDHLIVEGTEPRECILCHKGNFPSNTEGCILIGMGFGDLDKDKKNDIINSQAAMGLLVQFIKAPARLIVINA